MRRSPPCGRARRAPALEPSCDRQHPLPPSPRPPRCGPPAKGARRGARPAERGHHRRRHPRHPPQSSGRAGRHAESGNSPPSARGGRSSRSPQSDRRDRRRRGPSAPRQRACLHPRPKRSTHPRRSDQGLNRSRRGSRSAGRHPKSGLGRTARPTGTRRRKESRRRLEAAMETKRRYEYATPAAGTMPAAVAPERALRVFTQPERNPGTPLDLDLIRALRINRSAVERRAATIPTRRTVKKEWQAAWLLRAITCLDLTTLQGDDTATNVLRLCAKAQRPVRRDILEALGAVDLGIKVGAVCLYHAFVPTAVQGLEGSGIPVAAVSTGFPAGLSPLEQRIAEIGASVAAGAREIDIVITRAHVLTGNYEALYDEVRCFREACGEAHMKAILATGELATLGNVARASMVAMQAGADFIKTSTGKEGVNATIPFGIVMCRMIRDYFERTGYAIGFKPAGGIRSAKNALEYLYMMKEELGDRWLRSDLFRFGASGLLTDIERQLEHFVTGRYAAAHRQPMP